MNFELKTLALATNKIIKVVEATPSAVNPVVRLETSTRVASPSSSLTEILSSVTFYIFNLFFFSFILILWFLLVRWVGQDAQRRGLATKRKKIFQAVVLIFNLPGLLLYLLLRPAQTLAEIKRAEMEEELLSLELEKLRRESTSRHSERSEESRK